MLSHKNILNLCDVYLSLGAMNCMDVKSIIINNHIPDSIETCTYMFLKLLEMDTKIKVQGLEEYDTDNINNYKMVKRKK